MTKTFVTRKQTEKERHKHHGMARQNKIGNLKRHARNQRGGETMTKQDPDIFR